MGPGLVLGDQKCGKNVQKFEPKITISDGRLKDYRKVSRYYFIRAEAGATMQGIHQDFFKHGAEYLLFIPLDKITKNNGPTEIWTSKKKPKDSVQGLRPLSSQVRAYAIAANTWHRGRENTSEVKRDIISISIMLDFFCFPFYLMKKFFV